MPTRKTIWRRTGLFHSALAAVLLPLAAAHAESCGLKLLATLPMQDDVGGQLVVPITVEGTQQKMVIDTGGFVGMLTSKTVEALKLPKFEMAGTAYSLNGTMEHFTKARVDVGPLHANAMQFIVTRPFGRWESEGIAGTLGQNFLQRFDLDLDYAAMKANVMLQDHCPGQVVYWSKAFAAMPFETDDNGHILVPVTLDGKDFRAFIDTGSTVSTLSATAGGKFASDESDMSQSNSGSYTVHLHSLVFGGVAVQNPHLDVVADRIGQRIQSDEAMSGAIGTGRQGLPDVLIGNDILRHLHLYIAYNEKKLYVTAADAH